MAQAKKSVNLKAFSVIYDSENIALIVRYRGVPVETIKYGDHSEADISSNFTFEHYVKRHGSLIYKAILEEQLPQAIINKALRLELSYLPSCPGDVWNTPLFWESSACFTHPASFITKKALHEAYDRWTILMKEDHSNDELN